jgi:hypothetical protein
MKQLRPALSISPPLGEKLLQKPPLASRSRQCEVQCISFIPLSLESITPPRPHVWKNHSQ